MTAQQVLRKVLAAGGQIIPDPERPRLLVPPALERLVLEHRKALRQLLLCQGGGERNLPVKPETLKHFLVMPLGRFAEEGAPLEVRVPWLSETLWFVPGGADAEALVRGGVSRALVWTARELMDLLTIPNLTTEQVRTIAQAKLEFAGEVVEVRPQGGETSRRREDPEGPPCP